MKQKSVKRSFLAGILLAFLLLCIPGNAWAAAWDGTADTSWYDPDKTVYEIATPEQFAGLGVIVAGDNGFSPDNFQGKTIKITADLDLGGVQNSDGTWSGQLWQPIGRGYGLLFQGELDGQGHKITNLRIECGADATGSLHVGLFTGLKGGRICNLTIESGYVCVKNATKYVGAFVGLMNEGAKLVNCINKAAVYNDADSVGGLVGFAIESQILACANLGSVTGASAYAGGLVGTLNKSTVWGSYNNANVTALSFVGGITGTTQGSQISDCYNLGVIQSTQQNRAYAGGIFGGTEKQIPDDGMGSARNYSVSRVYSSYNAGKILSAIANNKSTGLLGGATDAEYFDCYALKQDNLPLLGLSAEEQPSAESAASIMDAASLRQIAEKLGGKYVSGGEAYPVFSWQQEGAPVLDELVDFRPEDVIDCTASGFTVVMNKRLGYEDFSADDLNVTITVDGKPQTLQSLKTTGDVINYNGQYRNVIQYSYVTVGAGKSVTLQVAYKQGEAIGKTFVTPQSDDWLDYAADAFAGGSGTFDDPYQISTPEQLARMAKLYYMPNAPELYDSLRMPNATRIYDYLCFKLTADLDMSAKSWSGANFLGSFDGNGHIIANLHGSSGLFSQIRRINSNDDYMGSQVANLIIKNANISTEGLKTSKSGDSVSYIGILANTAYECNFINCTVEDSQVFGGEYTNNIGGLVGCLSISDKQTFARISGCSLNNVVLKFAGSYGDVGGLVSLISNSGEDYGSVYIDDCYFNGNISGGVYCGGLLGYVVYTNGISVENCIVSGNMTDVGFGVYNDNGYVGGIIGYIPDSDAKFIGDDGINLRNNVVLLSVIDSNAKENISAIGKSMYIYTAAGTAKLQDNYVSAKLKINGQLAAAEDGIQFALIDDQSLSKRDFWEKIGYDFGENGLWLWDAEYNLPKLKNDQLAYAYADFVQQPTDAQVYVNQPAYFGVQMAGGLNAFSYQWQCSLNDGEWRNIDGATSNILEVKYSDGYADGYGNATKFRCVITEPFIGEIYTDVARLSISGKAIDAVAMRDNLLSYYQKRGKLDGALEAAAIMAAGGDPTKLQNDLQFYKHYIDNETNNGFDYFSAVYDLFALDGDIQNYTAELEDKTEDWNWLDLILDSQNAETGTLTYMDNRNYGFTNDFHGVAMMNILEMYFAGGQWGNESEDEKLGRDSAIAALLAMIAEPDNDGLIWLGNRSDFGTYSDKKFEAVQCEFVLLMFRLSDDPVWGEEAKAAAGQVLNSLITYYNSEASAKNFKNLRSNALLVSALTEAANRSEDSNIQAEYLSMARDILLNDILASGAVGGGYSLNKQEHSLRADNETTASVLMAVSDYINGKAFLANYVYELPPAMATEQALVNISFPITVSGDLTLPTQGAFGTTLAWHSANPAVIADDGKVTRAATRQNVGLTVTATKGDAVATRDFVLVVRAIGSDDQDDVDEALLKAKPELQLYTETVFDIKLPQSKVEGVEFIWSSSDNDIISADGKVTRPAVGAADKTVTLTLTAKKGNASSVISQNVLVYAQNNIDTPEGKIREAYQFNRTGYLQNRKLDGYWQVWAAYSVLGDYISAENGYKITLPQESASWYGTQYGAMVMGIVAAGENPYNYRGENWVAKLNKNYGGMYAAGLYSDLGMDAAGSNPAEYKHSAGGSGPSLVKNTAMGIDIPGWAAVELAAYLNNGNNIEIKNWFINYLKNERAVDKTGNFADSNSISTTCALMGLTALYWAGVEEANPLSEDWVNADSGKSIIDASYSANWVGQPEFATYSVQAVVTYGDLYNVLYNNGKPCWLAIALDKEKLDKQIVKAEKILAESDNYTLESVAQVKAALAVVKSLPADRLNATPADWGKEYFDLYDAVRFVEKLN